LLIIPFLLLIANSLNNCIFAKNVNTINSNSSYVEQEDTREVIDIQTLNKQIADIVKKQNE